MLSSFGSGAGDGGGGGGGGGRKKLRRSHDTPHKKKKKKKKRRRHKKKHYYSSSSSSEEEETRKRDLSTAVSTDTLVRPPAHSPYAKQLVDILNSSHLFADDRAAFIAAAVGDRRAVLILSVENSVVLRYAMEQQISSGASASSSVRLTAAQLYVFSSDFSSCS